ncbi:uncharacterized protein MYCFIDRAFT_209149 [Pseudocercospora fijiensis CIRAD86]|uniref:Jacalin-type lectin domain-containing protein n=1 Tax=Pseudocercospora fijiensis (strain CIRAD86) TaxID=383855 RepID=M3AKI1_PSEFD|nr:uncharacterized protein MYCFIDRAFT_209149 [Pseudocercospora fijiensis CIRAD86]EME77668.1 hypothetical protein MYCFIDRAFT_209149 [Pseudocercospora fijiensis CIRAD86]
MSIPSTRNRRQGDSILPAGARGSNQVHSMALSLLSQVRLCARNDRGWIAALIMKMKAAHVSLSRHWTMIVLEATVSLVPVQLRLKSLSPQMQTDLLCARVENNDVYTAYNPASASASVTHAAGAGFIHLGTELFGWCEGRRYPCKITGALCSLPHLQLLIKASSSGLTYSLQNSLKAPTGHAPDVLGSRRHHQWPRAGTAAARNPYRTPIPSPRCCIVHCRYPPATPQLTTTTPPRPHSLTTLAVSPRQPCAPLWLGEDRRLAAMPSFLKDISLRRRSKASIRNGAGAGASDSSNSESNSEVGENGHLQQPSKSSSTLSSFLDRRQSPPTTLSSQRSHSNLSTINGANINTTTHTPPPIPPRESRPRMPTSQSNRYSITVWKELTIRCRECHCRMVKGRRPQPRHWLRASCLCLMDLGYAELSNCASKVLLIFGQCADITQPIDGHLTVCHHQDKFPPTTWPVCDSHFKALVHLEPGPNRLRLDFTSPKLPAQNSSIPAHSSWININYLPLISAPPLQLCILLAKDSPETYDAVPERVQKEGNALPTAIRKFRMAAYLWQAFTAEQMNRNGFGRRCYRYEEEWQPGTLTWRDMESGNMRNEAKVHVIRMDKTVEEIQDLHLAQQYEPAKKKGDLFGIAMEAVKAYFRPGDGQRQYVSCMFLDTHWDKRIGTVRGHAALGGGDDQLKLAIFGSHCLQSYPAHIEEVVPAFSDCTRTDTNFVANDCNEGGSNWESANIGIGAHMHETGHLLGCPHQENGVMMRDYTRLNRTFTCREPYSTRTKQQGQRLCLPKDECTWHRLDTLRFRFHPTFQLPTDQASHPDNSVQVWTVENNTALITAATGVAWIEIYPHGDDVCHHWTEYLEQSAPRQINLTEQLIKDQLPAEKKKRKIKLKIFSCGGGELEIQDLSRLYTSDSKVKLPDGRPGFKGTKLGHGAMQGSQPQELILGHCEKKQWGAAGEKKSRLLLSVKVYHGDCLDGIEFCYEDGKNELFGKRGGRSGGSEFTLDTRRGEMLLGFYVRAGFWIDGIQIMTNTGRRIALHCSGPCPRDFTDIAPDIYLCHHEGTASQAFMVVVGLGSTALDL